MDWRTDRLREVHRLFGVTRGGRANGQHQGLQYQGFWRWQTCGMIVENVTHAQRARPLYNPANWERTSERWARARPAALTLSQSDAG